MKETHIEKRGQGNIVRRFRALGGALDPFGEKKPIGGSAYALFENDIALLIDAGAYNQTDDDLDVQDEVLRSARDAERSATAGLLDDTPPSVRSSTSIAVPFGQLREAYLPDFQVLEGMKHIFVIVTHAHNDHAGLLPFLFRQFGPDRVTALMTLPTHAICSWLWPDALGIMRDKGRESLYSSRDIRTTNEKIVHVGFGENIDVGPFSFVLYPAGHILGAAGVLVTARNPDMTMFFSGDYSIKDQHTVLGAEFPRRSVDYLVTETTYAGKMGVPREHVESVMVDKMFETLSGGGNVLFPALSSRVPEIFSVLQKHEIDHKYPIYIDGAGSTLADIYTKFGAVHPAIREHFVDLGGDWRAARRTRVSIFATDTPTIVITPSGMLSGGRAIGYFKAWAGSDRNLIALTSYQGPCSTGSQLLSSKSGKSKRVKVDGKNIRVRARVDNFALSAHCDGDEILQTIQDFRPRMTFMVHGDEPGMDSIVSHRGDSAVKAFLGDDYVL